MKAGLIAIGVILVGFYAAFGGGLPFQHPYTVYAQVRSANELHSRTPVRIAGVDVGHVAGFKHGPGGTAIVKLQLNDDALPLHRDATLKIRPRIFLEGNFFVDLKPGSPESPTVGSNYTVPMSQTYSPVQIDQVLGVLQGSARQSAQHLIQSYGKALNGKPLPGEDRRADPATKGLTAAQALNASLDYAVPALRGTAIVNQAFLGTEPH